MPLIKFGSVLESPNEIQPLVGVVINKSAIHLEPITGARLVSAVGVVHDPNQHGPECEWQI